MLRALLVLAAVAGCQRVSGLQHVGDAGPDAVDAPPRPDAPPGVCGLVGTPCCTSGASCTDGSQCLDLGSGHAQCILMAGAFQTTTPSTCQPTACESDDPFASTPCTCPAGFAMTSTTIDSGCGDVNNPSPQLGSVSLCTVSQFPTSSDFGGWFVKADIKECEPNSDACITKNAITSACTCPAPTQELDFRVWVPGVLGPSCQNGELGGTLGLCLDQTVAVASVRGAYEKDPDGSCRKSSFADCKCPAGSLESSIKTIADRYVNQTVSFMQSTITICLAPP